MGRGIRSVVEFPARWRVWRRMPETRVAWRVHGGKGLGRELAQVGAAGEANRAVKCGVPAHVGGIVAWSARLPQSSCKRTPNPLDVSAAVEVLVCAQPKGAHMPSKRTQRKTTSTARRRTKKAARATPKKARRTSLLNAAAAVLAKAQEPMTCPEMVEAVLKAGTWKTRGKTPPPPFRRRSTARFGGGERRPVSQRRSGAGFASVPPVEVLAEASPPEGDLGPSAPRVAPNGQAPGGSGGQDHCDRTAGNRDHRGGLSRAAPDAPTAVA